MKRLGSHFSVSQFFCLGLFLASLPSSTSAQNLSIYTLAGDGTPGATNGSSARFNHPAGVAADPDGNIYVADTENSTIRKITPDGATSTFAGTPGASGSADGSGSSAQFFGPQAVGTDPLGLIYVADTANSTIRK